MKAVIENYEVSGVNCDVDIGLVGAYVNVTFPKIFNTSHPVIDFFLRGWGGEGGICLEPTKSSVTHSQYFFSFLVWLFSVVPVRIQLNVT